MFLIAIGFLRALIDIGLSVRQKGAFRYLSRASYLSLSLQTQSQSFYLQYVSLSQKNSTRYCVLLRLILCLEIRFTRQLQTRIGRIKGRPYLKISRGAGSKQFIEITRQIRYSLSVSILYISLLIRSKILNSLEYLLLSLGLSVSTIRVIYLQ